VKTPLLSVMVPKQTLGKVQLMSVSPPKADIGSACRDVCFVPISLQKSVEGWLAQ
jgi:hypothetical protein